jgi:sulfate transport system ATP-binding protein
LLTASSSEQIGTPQQVYEYPGTAFVHEFIGESVVMPVVVESGDVRFDGRPIGLGRQGAPDGGALLFARPFDMRIVPSAEDSPLTGVVKRIHGIGPARRVEIAVGRESAVTIIEVDALRSEHLHVGQVVGLRPEQYRLYPSSG